MPWAMVFPTDPLGLPRYSSQLYEAVAEGSMGQVLSAGTVVIGVLLLVIVFARRRRAPDYRAPVDARAVPPAS